MANRAAGNSTAGPTTLARPERALEDGWTLPAAWYSDPLAFELERKRVFACSWSYAGPAAAAAADAETWGPFAFAAHGPDPAPLEDWLGEASALLSGSGLRLDELRFHSHYEWPLAANWKVALENYLECYHCPVAHPGFSRVIDVDPDAYPLVLGRTTASQVGPVRPSALAGGAPYDARGDVHQAQYHFLWPNTTINVDPGPQNLSIERWVPVGVRRTVEVTDYYFGPDVPQATIDELIAFGAQVGSEDVALVEGVQRGLDSLAVPQGRMLRESERLVADFQRRVFDALAAA
jgi:choline monooxygenase